jgi:outer membrane protein assembly factor BamA
MRHAAIITMFLIIGQHIWCNNAFAQQTSTPTTDSTSVSSHILVDRIFIIGNRKTKEKIIRREMQIKEGDILERQELNTTLERDKHNIQNTRLFLSVNTNIIQVDPEKIDIIVRVSERWYLFPSPIIELADRNFNEWWINQNHDFGRINYGLKLFKYNMRGHNETLKLITQLGFTKKFQVMYSFPYIDRNQKLGFGLVADHLENDNFNYMTIGDKQRSLDFLENTRWLFRTSRLGLMFSYRNSFYNMHYFGGDYFYNRIKDTVGVLNPNYFLDGRVKQKYLQLHYTFLRDLRDVSAYPLKGFLIRFNVKKLGLGFDDIDQLEISSNYAHYFDLGNDFYFSTEMGGITSYPKRQPYHNFNALGFEPFDMRGYELYVIEGQHLIYNRNTAKKRIFHKDFTNHLMPLRQFQHFPLSIYLKTFLDFGYVRNSWNVPIDSKFTNTPLWGGGLGIDFVTFYDMSLRLEYSWNKDKEGNFVLGVRRVF